jgi:hypothetical protein
MRHGCERATHRGRIASFAGNESVPTKGHGWPFTALSRLRTEILGRKVWSFISAMVTPKESVSQLVAALKAGERPWVARDIPSDYYTFAGEIPWHPNFASEALAENAYRGSVGRGMCPVEVEVEVLGHGYTWESYHSEMNCAGSTRVPSRPFSHRFDLHSKAQSFDQFLPDGSRATVTLSGIDGSKGVALHPRRSCSPVRG